LVVSVSLPKGATLEDPEHVRNALSKLYSRVVYYSSLKKLGWAKSAA
jgi:hypothetical protein